ncbi:transcription factor bHLH25-like, partial [Trifolium medium]|nr:transcription factor bHLH25-like [Trifolium medium]
VECVVTVNNGLQLSYDSSSNDESEVEAVSGNNEVLGPHVDARILDKDVLIRIHCKKQKGLLLKVLFEIQKLHLFVVNSSVLPFGDSILDITIVAQVKNTRTINL